MLTRVEKLQRYINTPKPDIKIIDKPFDIVTFDLKNIDTVIDRFINVLDTYIVSIIVPSSDDLDHRFTKLFEIPTGTGATTTSSEIPKLALGWIDNGDGTYLNLCNGLKSTVFPKVEVLGTPVPLPGNPESIELDRSIVQLGQIMKRWLSEYDNIFTTMQTEIDLAAAKLGWPDINGYLWGICQIIKSMAPFTLIELPTHLLSFSFNWKTHLVESFTFVHNQTNGMHSVQIYSKYTHQEVSKLDLSTDHILTNPNSTIQKVWNTLFTNSYAEHMSFIKAIFELSVVSRLIQPPSQLDFTSVGKQLPYRAQFFTNRNLAIPPVKENQLGIVFIPAVISRVWPYFFVAKGIVA